MYIPILRAVEELSSGAKTFIGGIAGGYNAEI
jgi:hypothetical protein